MPDTPYRAELDAALGAIARGDVVTFSPDVAARIMERLAHIDVLTAMEGQIGYTLDDPLMVAAKAVVVAWETRPYSGETVKGAVRELEAAIDAMEPHDA